MSESDLQMHRDIGRMESDIAALKATVDTMAREGAAMRAQLAEVHSWMQQARGSWKALAGAAGFGAAIVAVLSNIGSVIGFFRGH
jgi:hypothetical protein